MELKQKVEDALKRLERQTLVQKSSNNTYVFLTNEEQEINRAINSQPVEPREITAKVSETIFDRLYSESKYRSSELRGRYSYGFNRFVDNRPYRTNQNYPLTLKILTPASDELSDETTLRLLSGQSTSVLVVLPDDSAFLEEFAMSLKIENFLTGDAGRTAAKYEQINSDKRVELREHKEQAVLFLKEALERADIFVNGDRIQPNSKDAASRISEAMGRLVSVVYNKHNYIDTAVSDSDIRAIIRDGENQITLDGKTATPNQLALNEVADFIARNSSRHTKTSMKTITERFLAPPYGFIEADVQWLVARLFKDGEIAFYVNNEAVSLLSKSVDDIVRYITRKEYLEKLMIEKRVKANEKQKKAVRTVMKELNFGITLGEDDDTIMSSFMSGARTLKNEFEKLEIEYKNQPAYPGKKVITDGKMLLIDVLDTKYPAEFFAFVDSKLDDFCDLAEDYEPVRKFFAGEQKTLWDKSVMLMGIYDDSKTYIVDSEIEETVKQIKAILHKQIPYSDIFNLAGLNDQFINAHLRLVEAEEAPVLEAIQTARDRVFEELNKTHCKDKFSDKVIKGFEALKNKAQSCNNIATLKSISYEADALKIRLLNEISAEENKILAQLAAEQQKAEQEQPVAPAPIQRRRRNVSIKSLSPYSSWEIKSEADIDRYLAELRLKIQCELEDDTIINVEL